MANVKKMAGTAKKRARKYGATIVAMAALTGTSAKEMNMAMQAAMHDMAADGECVIVDMSFGGLIA